MRRLVALKVIRPDLLRHPTAVDRFQREVRAAAALSHPNIVVAFDAEGREVMYLHFHKLKQCLATIDFGFGDEPRAFTLSRRGIARR